MDITKYYAIEGEKPLDTIRYDGGFFGIFRTVAVIGDSLASGEMESLDENGKPGWHDYLEYSWGQYMARAAGNTVYNFSRGGMTAKEYMEGWGEENGCFDESKAAQAYIIGLGVNDVLNGLCTRGTVADIDLAHPENNAKTFMGYMGQLIDRYKKIAPKARFFLLTPPYSMKTPKEATDELVQLMYDLAPLYDYTYIIDLAKYSPIHDAEFRRNFYLGGHLSAAGYQITAWQIMSYIDYIVRNNPDDFRQIAFVGKNDGHHVKFKW